MARVEISSQGWGWIADVSGNGQPGVTVQIDDTDGNPATHYSAVTGGSSSTSSLTTNSDGTIPRFIDEGSYDLTAGGITRRVEAVAGSTVVLAESRVDVDAGNYLLGGGADDTATLQAAWDAASALGTVSRPAVLLIPPGEYLTDVVIPKSNVDVWGYGVTIKKRSNSTSSQTNNTLWRMLEVLDGSTYYGTYENISIRGIRFDGNGKSAGNSPDFKGAMLRFLYVENLLLEDIEVSSYCANSWALNLGGTGVLRRVRIRGGANLYEDGIHIQFGDWTIDDGYDVESGDDAISIGAEPDDPYLTVDPQPVEGVRVGRGRAVSAKVAGVKVYVRAAATSDFTIKGVDIDGVDAWGKNAPAVWCNDERALAAGSSQIIAPKVRGRFRTGDSTVASSARTGLSHLVTLTSTDDAEIDGTGEMVADSTASTGWRLSKATDSRAPRINLRCESLGKQGGAEFVRCTRAVLQGRMVATSDTNAALLLLTDSTVDVINAELLNQKSGNAIVFVATGAGTSELKARGGKWSHASGASAGLVFQTTLAADTAFVSMKDVDLRDAYLDTGSSPARPLGTNFDSITKYDVQDNPGLVTKARGNFSIGAAATSLQVSNMGTHINMISIRQAECVEWSGDPGSITKKYLDNQGPNGFRVNVSPAPGATANGYYVVDVGRKPAS